MLRFLANLARGHFRRHKLEALLCLLGVALGVAVVVAIDSAVDACVSSFRGAVDSLAERSTHAIFAADGQPLPDAAYIDLLRRKVPFPLAPVIERGVVASRTDADPTSTDAGTTAKLLGIDVFAEKQLRSFTQMQSSLSQDDLHRFLTDPGEVVLVKALADALHVKAGDALRLTIQDRRVPVHVAGVVEPSGVARTQLTDLIVADLATAQELAGAIGQLDRIDTRLENDAQVQSLEKQLPPTLALRSTRERETSLSDLIAAYKLNLNALSLMASFVAVFIVYNSMLISVQQRTTSLGILRCLGAGRGQLAGICLTEAVIYSVVGGVLGVVGGWLLSRVMVGYVSTTINDLYATVRPGPVTLGAREFAKGLTLSTASCLVGAVVPLLRASRTPPVNAFRTTERADLSRKAAGGLVALGVALLLASLVAYALPTNSPVVGFAMAVLIALGFAFACPWLVRLGARAVDRAARPPQWLPVQMAGSGVARALGITGIAVAATMLAMAMNVGVRTMVSSFRGALANWVEQRFAADVFIGAELLVNHKIDASLAAGVRQWVERQPQVAQIIDYRGRQYPVAGKPTLVVGTNVADLIANHSIPIKQIPANPPPFDPARDALISEPLAGRTKLHVGDTLTVDAPAGPQSFHVYAIFFDFGSERGQVMLDRHTYAAAWLDPGVNSLHVRLKPGVDAVQTVTQWTPQLRKHYPVVLNSFKGLKADVMTVFDRTFKVTEVLTWLAGGVAFCGLAGSLLAVSLARQKDYGVLTAVGMSGRQTLAWVVVQGFLLAWLSALVAAAAGTALAYVLAYVIQYRSFGWSIPTSPQPRFWLQCFELATVAALVAALYPAYRLRAAPPAGTLRQE